MVFMVLVALEGFDEEDGFDQRGEHRDDLLLILYGCDVEAVFGRSEIEGAAFDNLSVSKMNNHSMLHHSGTFSSQLVLLEVVLSIFSPNSIFQLGWLLHKTPEKVCYPALPTYGPFGVNSIGPIA
jgi:hypothetical protein